MLNWSTLIRRTTCMTQWTAKEQCIRIQMWLRRVVVATSLAFACLSPTIASAGAIRIFDQSASGTAQSGAFAAQADDPSAVYFNPAGLTQLKGVQTSFGVMLVGGHTAYTSPT